MPVKIQTERLTPPQSLLTCAPAPVVPVTKEQARVGEYVADLWSAGDDCRSKLAAVKSWVDTDK